MDDSSRRFEAVKVGEQRDKGRRLQEWMDGLICFDKGFGCISVMKGVK